MPSMGRVAEIASVLDTGNTARQLLGGALTLLHSGYEVTDTYQVGPLGSQPAGANRQYLDGIRIRAESDYGKLPATNEPLDTNTASQVAFDIASIESAVGQTLDILGGNTALGDLGDSIVDAGKGIVDGAVKAVTGSVPWWVWLLVVGAVVVIVAAKVKGKT